MEKIYVTSRILALLAVTALSPAAWADSYDFTFIASTADDTVANGQLTVVGDIATSGYLDVTAGPDIGAYTLVTGTGQDSSFVYDDFVFPGSDDGYVDSTAGLLWSQSGVAGNSSEMNMWFNPVAQHGAPADTYSLWGAPDNWNLEAHGDVTLTPVQPVILGNQAPALASDGGSTSALLIAGLGGLVALRRKLLC
jgi:hypothetical protein